MRNWKHHTKRGLALFLVLMMCLSLLPTAAFAAESEHAHNEDGWTCVQAEPEKELTCLHEHGEDCYVPGEPKLDCEEEHEHTEDCYVPGEDVLDCAHEHGEDCWTVTEGAWTCTPPAAEEPEEEEAVPAEVQEFLDAVDAVMTFGDLTEDNAEEYSALYETAMAAYEAVQDAGLDDDERVTAAIQQLTSQDVEVEGELKEGSVMLADTGDSNVKTGLIKSAWSQFYAPQDPGLGTNTYNCVSGNMAETGYGLVVLLNEGDSATDSFVPYFYGNHYTGYPYGYNSDLTSQITYSNSGVATADVTWDDTGRLNVEITKGSETGATNIYIWYNVTMLHVTSGIASDSDTAYAVSGLLVYTVGDESITHTNISREYWVTYDLNPNASERISWRGSDEECRDCDTVFGDDMVNYFGSHTGYYKNYSGGSKYYGDPYSWTYPFYFGGTPVNEIVRYPQSVDSVKQTNMDESIAVIDSYTVDGDGNPVDASGALGLGFAVTGLKVGTIDVSFESTCTYPEETFIGLGPDYDWFYKDGYTAYRVECEKDADAKVYHTIHVTVIDTTDGEDITITYHDGSITAKDTGKEGDEFTIRDALTSKTDYVFEGWATSDGGNVVYKPGEKEVFNASKDLYAVWAKKTQTGPSIGDLTVTKDPSEEYPIVGEEFKYTITVNNDGSVDATVTVTDKLPATLDFVKVSQSDGGVYDKATRIVTWEDVKVPANGSKELHVWVKANTAGKIKNTANVTLPNGGSASGNTEVTAKDPAREVTVVKKFEGIEENQIPANFLLRYSFDGGTEWEETKLQKGNSEEKAGLTYTWKIHVPAGKTLTLQEANANVAGYTRTTTSEFEPEGGSSSGDPIFVPAGTNTVTITNNYAPETPVAPNKPVIAGKDGQLRVQVICDTHENATENLRLRTPEETSSIKEFTDTPVTTTDKDGYEWEYTVTLYQSDFATRFNHNSEGDHVYRAGTPETVAVTFYYKDGAWDYENLRTLNPSVEMVYERNGSDDYFCNYVRYHVVQEVPKTYALNVEKTYKEKVVDDEDWVTYTVTVTNAGNQTLYNTKIVDTMDLALEMDPDSIKTSKDLEDKGTKRMLEPVRDNGLILWKPDGDAQRLAGGSEVYDHTWFLNGGFAPGEEVIITYDAKVIYPEEETGTFEFRNYADAIASKNADTAPAYTVVQKPSDSSARTLRMSSAHYSNGDDFVSGGSGNQGGSGTGGGNTGSGGSGEVVVEKNVFKLTYDFAGGKMGGADKKSIIKGTAKDVTFYDFTVNASYQPELAGHKFLGWADTKDAHDAQYTGGETITTNLTNSAKTIYAVWEKLPDPEVTITVKYVDEDGKPIGTPIQENVAKDRPYNVADKIQVPDGYAQVGLKDDSDPISGTADSDKTITIVCGEDKLVDPNRDLNDDKPGDGIPDSWQYTVTYRAVNGTVDITTAVVTKLDQAGQPDANGKAVLAANQVATATPNEGFHAAAPLWSPTTPVADLEITENTEFVAAFVANEPDQVIVTAGSVVVTYDGQGHPVTSVAVTKNGQTVTPDNNITITYTQTGTNAPVNAGTYTATITAQVDGQTVTGTATVTILQRALTVRTGSANKRYDGYALTNSSITITGQAPGESITGRTTGSQTRVGESPNGYTLTWGAGVLSSNYRIVESLGILRVTNAGSSGGSSGGRPGTNPTNPGAGNTTTIGDVDVPLAGDLQLNKTDHFAYIKGYQDGTVRPNNPITRAQVATIFYRLLDETSRVIYFQETNDFTDVTDSYWANKAISTLSNAGIITGFNDGTFRPNAYITRAQFAAIAARFDNVVPGLNNPFTDVAEDYWARDLIAFAADRGWITGNGGKFRPLENITRVEVMDFINNVLERHVDKDGLLENAATWSDVPVSDPNYYVVEEATNSHDYTRRTEGQLMENWTKLNEDPVWDE